MEISVFGFLYIYKKPQSVAGVGSNFNQGSARTHGRQSPAAAASLSMHHPCRGVRTMCQPLRTFTGGLSHVVLAVTRVLVNVPEKGDISLVLGFKCLT